MSVNHEVKGQLAKLLATENLVIEHKKVPTASFDVLNRILTLPIWDKASSLVYDLLVGHEVGHALYTPNEDWQNKISDEIPKDYLNVVEDARIEKLMKRKFPGLARTFYNGYSELNRDDFFGIADENLEEMILIDRINLHFKIGAHSCIPFKKEEKYFVEMIESAETFDEVLRICELIYQHTKEKAENSVPNVDFKNNQTGSGQQGQGGGNQNTTQSQHQNFGDQESQISNNQEIIQDQPNTEDNNSQSKNSDHKPGGENKTQNQDETSSKTQKNFEDKTKNLTNHYTNEIDYVERPDLKIDQIVVPCDKLTAYVSSFFEEQQKNKCDTIFSECDESYKKYRNESQKEVNYLVKDFEMKKSADAYQRMSTSRTGTLDTKMLHTYKYNDDIFRKISVIPDGKNHGLIFVLDWSGSMCDYLLDTVKQLMNLVWFCKKVQIPFEVYGFTQEWSNSFIGGDNHKEHYKRKHGLIDVFRSFSMLNFVSSKVNNRLFEEAMMNLWRLAYREDNHSYSPYSIPNGLDLSGTPLNESIMALHHIIPDFKNKNKLQKVNVVILTDGEANNIGYNVDLKTKYGQTSRSGLGTGYVNSETALRDRKIGHVYRRFQPGTYSDGVTSILLENLKDNFPEVNLIGFRIIGGSAFSGLYRDYYHEKSKKVSTPDEVMKIWRKEKSYELNGLGYDALYFISSSNLSASTSIMTLDENPDTTDISKAFRTMLKKKATNKKLLSSFASLVS
jgi:hypothetical protein